MHDCCLHALALVIWLFCRSLAVGSKSGYKFFSLSSVDKLEQIYECSKCLLYFPFVKQSRLVELELECSPLLPALGGSNPHSLGPVLFHPTHLRTDLCASS